MNREKRDRRLWHRMEGYSFHERPLTRSLIDVLSDETGHSKEICYTLVEEYRRFMYLQSSTDDTLSPSPIVHLVWQLHMRDRKAYFDDFCPRIIGRTLLPADHLPPLQDDPAYERALDDYAQEFGLAKVQYWPDPDVAVVRASNAIMWMVGLAAFAFALFFSSFLFAVLGMLVVCSIGFMQWKFSSLPLYAPTHAQLQQEQSE